MARTLLCIVPHPDDAEFAAGGFLARMSDEGVRVLLAVATDGSRGTFDTSAGDLADIRHAEMCRAAQVLGADAPISLGFEDFSLDLLSPGMLRERIAYLIRRYRPDILVSQDPFGYADPHPDHRALAMAVLEAASFSHLPRLYPEHIAAGMEPWFVVEKYYYNPSPARANRVIDISSTFSRKIAALLEHRSQIEFLVDDILLQLRRAGLDATAVAGIEQASLSFEMKCGIIEAALRHQAEEIARHADRAAFSGSDVSSAPILAEAFHYERFHPIVEEMLPQRPIHG